MAHSDKLPLTGGMIHSRSGERATRLAQQEKPATQQPDLFDYTPPITDALETRTCLPPEEAPVFVVTSRAFSARDKEDSWLYCLVSPEEGEKLIQSGLTLDARQPLLLCARPAVLPLLAQHAEEAEPCHTQLLRVRHLHVAPWLENDPDMSARLGGCCYLLSRGTPVG